MNEPYQTTGGLSNPALQGFRKMKPYSTDDNLLLKYVHKKFGVATIKTTFLKDRENIKQETNLPHRQEYTLIKKCLIYA